MSHAFRFGWMAFALVIAGCTRLPANFDSLPPRDKVNSYVTYLRDGGAPHAYVRQSIAAGGREAADAIALELRGAPGDDEKIELVVILSDIQSRGTDLRGTSAEGAVRQIVADTATTPALRQIAKTTIDGIDGTRR